METTNTQQQPRLIPGAVIVNWLSVLWLTCWTIYLNSINIGAKGTVVSKPFAAFVIAVSLVSLAVVIGSDMRILRRPASKSWVALIAFLVVIASVPLVISVAGALAVTWARYF